MGGSRQPAFHFLLIVLAVLSLAALGARLWPWQEALGLPGGLIPVVDLTVVLTGYILLAWWLGGYGRKAQIHSVLVAGVFPGLMAGVALGSEVLIRLGQGVETPTPQAEQLIRILLVAACAFWALAGFLGRRAGGSKGSAMLAGLWSGLLSGMMACATVLCAAFFTASPSASSDPWKQYESLAVANPRLDLLARDIETATWFALIIPLAAAALGFFMGGLAGRWSHSTPEEDGKNAAPSASAPRAESPLPGESRGKTQKDSSADEIAGLD